MSRSRRTVVGLVAAAVLAGACSNGEDEATLVAKPGTTISTTSTTAARPSASPLTGLPMEAGDLDRPVVVVKVDNSNEARPQSGIDLADIVYEEKVEGTVVRFLAVFHSRDADLVGPIRSVRSTDAAIVAPLGGVFAYSGGIPTFVSQIKKVADTVSEMENESAFKLRVDRKRPYKTYAATDALRAFADDDADGPPELFRRPDAGAGAPAAGTPASRAVIVYGQRTTAQWDWDATAQVWKRTTNGTPHTVEKGGQLGFGTVIVQPVAYRNTGFKDTSGGQVDQAELVGEGDATILTMGRQIRARWTKSSEKAVTRYVDATTGEEIAIPPGTVWVSLPPLGAPVTIT